MNWPVGGPALLVLILTVLGAIQFNTVTAFAIIHRWRHEDARLASIRSGMSVHKEASLFSAQGYAMLLCYVVRLALVAFPFFLWALFNTITRQFDLGCVSFGLVLAMSLTSVISVRAASRDTSGPTEGRLHLAGRCAGACCFVVFNYVIGLYYSIFVLQAPFLSVYFLAACLCWGAAAHKGRNMQSSSIGYQQVNNGAVLARV
jgi:hypothetical protein